MKRLCPSNSTPDIHPPKESKTCPNKKLYINDPIVALSRILTKYKQLNTHQNWRKCHRAIQCTVNKDTQSSDTCYNMNLKAYAKWMKEARHKTPNIWFYLYKISSKGKSIKKID